jgi:glycosyltransferase involved in cell wall biosynthesis
MRLPKISVITPCFNHVEFIDATMKSIHSQGYPDLEHIVIDGGSTDGSVPIIAGYEDALAYWTSEPDGGQTDALIKGFDRASGEIFCWLNSDDLFEPTTLREVGEFFAANPEVQFVYGDSRWVDRNGVRIKPKREHGWNRFVWLYDHNFIAQPSAFWRADLYRAVGGLDVSFDMAMDADLWGRFAEVTQPRHVRRFWSSMRFYPEQKNTRMRQATLVEVRKIRDRYVEPASPVVEALRSAAARVVRVGAKASSGGYPPSEVGQHLAQLAGFGSWEKRYSRRDDQLAGK